MLVFGAFMAIASGNFFDSPTAKKQLDADWQGIAVGLAMILVGDSGLFLIEPRIRRKN